MSGKFAYKMVVIITVILVIVGFRELIYTDSTVGAFFSTLIGQIPFAKLISDNVCKVLKFKQNIPIISTVSVMSDLLRLAIMALIQPVVMGFLTKIFLPVRRHTNQILLTTYAEYEMQEKYMNSFSYKIKELALNIIAAPLMALLAAGLTSQFFKILTDRVGNTGVISMGTVMIVVIVGLSIIPLLKAGMSVGRSVTWRLLITLASSMVNTFMTNALCIVVLLTVLGGVSEQIAGSILALVIWLIAFDCAMTPLKRAIVGK